MRILKNMYISKDKKYVCQRGQFEGFHVESVEFCKLKIAQGPPGPQGSPGATGTTGPPRITQLNVTNTYQIGESFLNNFTTSDNLIQVFCNNGDSVIAGGYRILAITAPLEEATNLVVATDRPILDPLGSGWEVEIIPTTDVSILYNVHTIRFDNPPLRP